jgi:hypothetical protein
MATTIQSTTNSTSGSTGALVVNGGVGIKKDLFVEGNFNVTGTTNLPPDPNVEIQINNINNEIADLQTAVGSVNDAATSAANAYASEQAAIAAKNEAVLKAGEAAGSAAQSATSSNNAATSATQAGNSATASSTYKDQALTYATNAGNSASLASTKADLAASSASAAGNSASAASTHASSAYTSAQNAAASASAAAVDYSALSARVGTAEANITSETSARVAGDTALSNSITTLTSTVGSHTTSISTLTSTTNGLNARWSVTVNNNGTISGIVLNSTGAANGGTPTSAVVIAANSFAIVDPFTQYTSGTTPSESSMPFEVTGGVTYLKSAAIKQNISSYNFNSSNHTGWNIDRNGNILTYGTLEIRDNTGAIVLSTGGNMDFSRINGSTKPENNATYGANGSNLSISHSGNMLPNSDFVSGIQNWVVSWNAGGGTNYQMVWDLATSYWAPAGGHTIGVVRNGTTQAASSWFDIMYDKFFPMQAGISFELSGYLAAHRCGVELRIAYYTSAQAYISETGWGTSTPPSGGNDLNNWARLGGIATTPANTAYVRIWVRGSGVDAGQSEPYFWATKIFFGLTKTGQTVLSPWSPATSSGAFAELSQINASNATTYIANAAIGNALIANAAIGTANIIDANITTLKVQGGAITAPEVYTWIPLIGLSNHPAGTLNSIYYNYNIIEFPITTIDINTTRLVILSFELEHSEDTPGTLRVYMRAKYNSSGVATSGSTGHFYTISPQTRMIGGYNNTSYTLLWSIDTYANLSNSIMLTIAAENYTSTTNAWSATSEIGIRQTKIFCFTGKR